MPAVPYHTGQFPPDDRLDWSALVPRLGRAAAAVARYDGMLAALPSPDLLLSPLGTQEAVLSSRIEGAQATMGEVLAFEAGQEATSPARRDDIGEILNYRRALRQAETMLSTLPLSQRVIRETHRTLLSGVRGAHRSPGAYRRTATWIGPPGSTIEDARFVPIGADRLADAMSAWERYLHRDAPDRLVQLAILHAEFEALHPFYDGNGRLGRMLIPLWLWQQGLIRRPTFYISAYIEARRDAYYERLLAVSRDDDWTGWCRFFLDAVQAQAEDNLRKTQALLDLYKTLKRLVEEVTRSQYAVRALDWIVQHPMFTNPVFIAEAAIPRSTARRLLDRLSDEGILRVIRPARGRRPAIQMLPALLDIVEGNDVQ